MGGSQGKGGGYTKIQIQAQIFGDALTEDIPCAGRLNPGMSCSSSVYMFFKLGGTATPRFTEKHSPWACPLS